MERLLSFYALWAFGSFFFYPPIGAAFGFDLFNPHFFYEKTKMNWIGSIVSSATTFIIFPTWGVIAFLWWLFHVGKRG